MTNFMAYVLFLLITTGHGATSATIGPYDQYGTCDAARTQLLKQHAEAGYRYIDMAACVWVDKP